MPAPQFEIEEFSGSTDEARDFLNRRYEEITEAGGTVLLSSLVVGTHPFVRTAKTVTFAYTKGELPSAVRAEEAAGIHKPRPVSSADS